MTNAAKSGNAGYEDSADLKITKTRVAQDQKTRSYEEWAELSKIKLPQTWTSKELSETDFPEPEWIVPEMIPEGLTIVAGAPKIGKSWFALWLASQLAAGGQFLGQKLEWTPVLYLALEDTPRRLKQRLQILEAVPEQYFYMSTEWPRGKEALKYLEAFNQENPEVKLIIIDTLGRIKSKHVDSNSYDDTVDEIAQLKRFGDEHGISIILVHHTRKMIADDYLHTISGSIGITGTADTVLALGRSRGQADAFLKGTGRDIDEYDLALRFNGGKWTCIGEAEEIQSTKERQDIFNLLKVSTEPLRTKDISDSLEKSNSTICHTLKKMADDGTVKSPKYGTWKLSDNSMCSIFQSSSGDDIEHFERIECKVTPISGYLHEVAV